MTQAAKTQEPPMEEILASIRRIIADDDAGKPAKTPEAAPPKFAPAAVASPPPRPLPPAPPEPAADQTDVDAVLADLELPGAEPQPQPEPAPEPAEPAATEVLDVTDAMTASASSPDFRTIDGTDDVVFTGRASEPPPVSLSAMEPPAPPPQTARQPDAGLISNATAAAVDSAFNTLAHTVLGQNARTLEDLVREMLRPMLKSWLDDNLPGLVERIVRAEIERVSRGKP